MIRRAGTPGQLPLKKYKPAALGTEEREIRKWDAVIFGILLGILLLLLLYLAAHKTLVLANNGQDIYFDYMGTELENMGFAMSLEQTAGDGVFYLPLEEGVDANRITVEDHYLDRRVIFRIPSGSRSFYQDHAIYGDTSAILAGVCEENLGEVQITLQLDRVYETETLVEEDLLQMAVTRPGEDGSLVLLVEPQGEGEERQIAFDVVRMLNSSLAEENIRCYIAGTEGKPFTREECLELLQEIQPTLYLQLGCVQDQNAGIYGISGEYNNRYYVDGYGNLGFAESLVRSVAESSKNRAIALTPVEGDSILQDLSMPAARLNLGYLSNPEERELLGHAFYREHLALGIKNALKEAEAAIRPSVEEED